MIALNIESAMKSINTAPWDLTNWLTTELQERPQCTKLIIKRPCSATVQLKVMASLIPTEVYPCNYLNDLLTLWNIKLAVTKGHSSWLLIFCASSFTSIANHLKGERFLQLFTFIQLWFAADKFDQTVFLISMQIFTEEILS